MLADRAFARTGDGRGADPAPVPGHQVFAPWQDGVHEYVAAFQLRTPVPLATVTMVFTPSTWLAFATAVELYPVP